MLAEWPGKPNDGEIELRVGRTGERETSSGRVVVRVVL
jgi:hypothetical protein